MPEQRKMERFNLQLPATLTLARDKSECDVMELLTSDVCAGGAFFETNQPLPLGTEVSIDLVLPLDELKKLQAGKAHIKLSGAVIRIEERGMAICFEEGFKIRPLP